MRPATMAARLAPYLRYYGSGRPLEDHGLLPRVLVVFEDELAADHFLRIAAHAVARAEVPHATAGLGSPQDPRVRTTRPRLALD